MLVLFLLFVGSSACYFRVFSANGSQSWCLDEECARHVDLLGLEPLNCRTSFLSLRFSSSRTYERFLRSTRSLSPLFATGRPTFERLLQVELLAPLEDDRIFDVEQLKFLADVPPSNIDTYELIFPELHVPIVLDEELFFNTTQHAFDTLRLIFNCTANDTVEWELVQSIGSLPDSPCPQRIVLGKKRIDDRLPIVTVGCIAFACLIITVMVGLVLVYSLTNTNDISTSRIELIERF